MDNRVIIDGRIYPGFDPNVIRNVPNIKIRSDDILICSWPKSGCHWLFEICRMLQENTVDLPAINKSLSMLEFTQPSEIDMLPSPRILNTHVRIDKLPTDIFTKRPKIVYITRNPKDVAVSAYNHRIKLLKYGIPPASFSDHLETFLLEKGAYGSWFESEMQWEQFSDLYPDLDVHYMTYEDLKQCTVKEITKLTVFLGLERSDEFIQQVTDKCNFKEMEKRNGDLMGRTDGKSNIYRKGQVGDWKNWLTVAQNEQFDEIYQQKMINSKLQFKFTL